MHNINKKTFTSPRENRFLKKNYFFGFFFVCTFE